jgi:hypothetical protein
MTHHPRTGSYECQPAAVVTAHGTLAELDLVVEAVLTLGATAAASPPDRCPDNDGCYVLRLCVMTDLTRDRFDAAFRAARAHRN